MAIADKQPPGKLPTSEDVLSNISEQLERMTQQGLG